MDALFGEGRADKLRAKVAGAKPRQREEMVLKAMSEALRDMGGEFVLPFSFRNEEGRLTHHLVFVSKHFKGYDAMKDIMAKAVRPLIKASHHSLTRPPTRQCRFSSNSNDPLMTWRKCC